MKKHVLNGSPKEIGYQHGSIGKKQVINSLETYEKLFYGYQKLTWEKAREEAKRHVEAIEKHDAELIEEMEGVADGAGVDFEDILALNARTEIALANYGGKGFTDGCTAIGVCKPISQDVIIGQNWDWKGSQSNSLLLLEIEQKNKPKVTIVTEGGMVGKIGFNDAGVGLCFNALLTDKKSSAVPIHLALRSVLNSFSLSEAVSKLKGGQVAASASMLIGKAEPDGEGMAVNLEVSPFGIDYVGEDSRLVHTNHILSNEIKKFVNDRNEFRFEDSMLRKKRAEQLIATSLANGEEITEETFKKWLSDNFNAPNGINHDENPLAPEHRRMETVFSIIMNLSKRNAFLCVGKPRNGDYIKLDI